MPDNQAYVFSIIYRVNGDTTLVDWVGDEIIRQDFELLKPVDYIYQLEKGEKEGKLHFQCYLKLSEKMRPSTLQDVLEDGLSSQFKNVGVQACTPKGKIALKNYCMKSTTRVEGPWYKNYVYQGEDLDMMENPLQWQQSLLNLISEPADDRTIHWVYNDSGSVGKSKLTKYLSWKKLALTVPFGSASQIKTAICNTGARNCYLVDIPRSTGKDESMRDMFSALECIKNGHINSSMYGKGGQELFMKPPHVIVFSNMMPDFKLASKDRWKVYTLENKTDILNFNQEKNSDFPFILG